MGDWRLAVPLLRSWLDHWAALLSKLPQGMTLAALLLAALLLPVAIALFARRIIVVVGCLLFALIAILLLVAPSDMTATAATGFYVGSLFIALWGAIDRRKAEHALAKIAELRDEMDRLWSAEETRVLRDIRSSKVESAGISLMPASGDTVEAAKE